MQKLCHLMVDMSISPEINDQIPELKAKLQAAAGDVLIKYQEKRCIGQGDSMKFIDRVTPAFDEDENVSVTH